MKLSDPEKSGLQIFRNYTKAFDEHAQKAFAKKVDAESHEATDLIRVLAIILHEDARALPIIACAYADEVLQTMYKRVLPDGFPGGKAELFSAFGPFSVLSNKIKMAYCFDLISTDLLVDLDHVRKIRNDISHAWDHASLKEFFGREPISKLFATEELFGPEELAISQDCKDLPAEARFRIRLGWVLARFTYEALLYQRAKSERLNPHDVLYGKHRPRLLAVVAKAALSFTHEEIGKTKSAKSSG